MKIQFKKLKKKLLKSYFLFRPVPIIMFLLLEVLKHAKNVEKIKIFINVLNANNFNMKIKIKL
jgi:hypothetical protein